MSIAKNENDKYVYCKNINNVVTAQLLRRLSQGGNSGCNEYDLREYDEVKDIVEVVCECAFNGWKSCVLNCDPEDSREMELMKKMLPILIDMKLRFSVNYLPELKSIVINVTWWG